VTHYNLGFIYGYQILHLDRLLLCIDVHWILLEVGTVGVSSIRI